MDKKNEFIEKVINPIKENTMKPYLLISLTEEKTLNTESKVGGQPYFPEGFQYPSIKKGKNKGKPLYFMAQINFEEMPHLENFPQKGILQFYFSDDEIGGVDYGDEKEQNRHRIIYHENIDKNIPQQKMDIEIKYDSDSIFRDNVELKMKFKLDEKPINPSVYNFDDMIIELYNKTFKENITRTYDLEEELSDIMYDELGTNSKLANHIVGGYPTYTQLDPRIENNDDKEYNIVLFQLDSEEFEECEIIWGDCGMGCFLIREEDLKNRNFTSILYTWDCY